MDSMKLGIEENHAAGGARAQETGPPKAAYIHVPFCAHRCGYCNFTVISGRDDLVNAYLDAIEVELSGLGEPRPVETIFFGGGTPTQLPPDGLERLLETVARWFPLSPGGENTVEANPADLKQDDLARLAAHGVTRISLGAQSLDAGKLGILERDHRGNDVRRAVELGRRYVTSVSLDLIYAVPGETLEAWTRDLAAAIALEPNHFSIYGLTYERGARFWSRRRRGELKTVDEATEAAMYEAALDQLTRAGFEHYEISNFARTGHRCRHNETYWTGQEYYAAGPGAARYVSGTRSVNHRSTTTYLNRVLAGRSPIAESETLLPEDRARETLVFGLRRLEGVDGEAFIRQTGYRIEDLAGKPVSRFVELGLLERRETRLRLTRRGLLVSDSMWPHFLRR